MKKEDDDEGSQLILENSDVDYREYNQGKRANGLMNTATTSSYLGTEQTDNASGLESRLASSSRIRGKQGIMHNNQDMIEPQDQAMLEWSNIEFYVPVK